jgi:hypothetical protein
MNAGRTGSSEIVYLEVTDLRLHKRTIPQGPTSVWVNLDILAVGQPRPINHQFQTYHCTAPTEAMGHELTS